MPANNPTQLPDRVVLVDADQYQNLCDAAASVIRQTPAAPQRMPAAAGELAAARHLEVQAKRVKAPAAPAPTAPAGFIAEEPARKRPSQRFAKLAGGLAENYASLGVDWIVEMLEYQAGLRQSAGFTTWATPHPRAHRHRRPHPRPRRLQRLARRHALRPRARRGPLVPDGER